TSSHAPPAPAAPSRGPASSMATREDAGVRQRKAGNDMTMMQDQQYWAHVDLNQVPDMRTPAPGPRSKEMHARCTRYFKGLSGQVKLFPVAFESGKGCVLTDVDGNRYLDFSSGIYVTTLGHCHPKV